MKSKNIQFDPAFEALTGYSPMEWQSRLFKQATSGDLPSSIDLPTGLGKTSVMVIWLITRALKAPVPRRLVYVVDRRAVVDQATEFAVKLREKLDCKAAHHLKNALGLEHRALSISTLRGQYVDNREWLDNPTSPAIVVGTVDMIGSRLLFEGYGVSRKMRPYQAGLLGADTLVVLDEAHLVPPFERLLEAISSQNEIFGPKAKADRVLIPAFKLLSLSATGRERRGSVFRLEDRDLKDPVVQKRLNATKNLTLINSGGKSIEDALALHAWNLSKKGQAPIRCVIYCDRRDAAEKTKLAIEKLAKTKKKGVETKADTELFVGARRVFERVWAAQRLEELGFIAGSNVEWSKPAFLIATSAGEVGVDLDADHMVCDVVAWERMVQRLGRVNRRGEGSAQIVVVDQGEPKPKKANAPTTEETRKFSVHRAALDLIQRLPKHDDASCDASPGALRELKERARNNRTLNNLIETATTSAPLRPAPTRALVDAWSMTSLKEHTGRPEIRPWLRGWVDDPPRTAVLWRTQLPMRRIGYRPTKTEIEAFFEAAPPHASEVLETETYRVLDWLMERAVALLKRVGATAESEQPLQESEAPEDTSASKHVNEMPANTVAGDNSAADQTLDPAEDTEETVPQREASIQKLDTVAVILSPAGDLRKTYRLHDFISFDTARGEYVKKEAAKAKQNLETVLIGATLIVDARLAGLGNGLLDADASGAVRAADDGQEWINKPVDRTSETAADSPVAPIIGFRVRSVTAGQNLYIEVNWRERFRLSIERNEDGEGLRWLVVEKWRQEAATEDDRSAGPAQALEEHLDWTAQGARALAQSIGLPDPYVKMLVIAARLHDKGKRSERWQNAFNAPRGNRPYAKTRGPVNVALLDHYRHEFGSLPLAAEDTNLQALPADLQDLALHLIAAHHGHARPIIDTRGCEDAPPSALNDRALQVALRFARLQKRWGPWGLAWWEALLRAMDQQASRDNDARENNKAKRGA